MHGNCRLMLLCCALLLAGGCADDDIDVLAPVDPGGGTGEQISATGTISGVVRDGHEAGCEGVTVTAGGIMAITNEEGRFVLMGLADGRHVVTFRRSNYQSACREVTVVAGRPVHFLPSSSSRRDDAVICTYRQLQFLDNDEGGQGEAENGWSTVEFPPDSFMDADGIIHRERVRLSLFGLSSYWFQFTRAFPAPMIGVTNDGVEVPLRSRYVMGLEAMFYEYGPAQLVDGAAVTLEVRVRNEDVSSAPAVIPVWRLDLEAGRWREGGEAVLVGNTYRGQIDELGTWTLAAPVSAFCTITGAVEDETGQPLAGARVICRGVDANYQEETLSGDDGSFTLRAIPEGEAVVWTLWGRRAGDSHWVDVEGADTVMLDRPLEVQKPAFVISLAWGESPADLDTRFYVPMGWDPEFDGEYDLIYYGDHGDDWGRPYAELDADDSDSYGPETITGYRLVDGTYQYWVHHWDGVDPAAKDGDAVTVHLGLDGENWLFERSEAPDAGQCWHVFDLLSGEGVATVVPILEMGTPPPADIDSK